MKLTEAQKKHLSVVLERMVDQLESAVEGEDIGQLVTVDLGLTLCYPKQPLRTEVSIPIASLPPAAE